MQENATIKDDLEDEDGVAEKYCPFELPEDEYGEMMFARRLAMEGSSSPVTSRTSRHPESRRGSTVADTDGKSTRLSMIWYWCRVLTRSHCAEPRSSPAPSRGRKSNRTARQPARETRSTRLQTEVDPGSQSKGSDEDDDDEEISSANEDIEEEGDEATDGARDSEGDEEADGEKGELRSTRAQTSRTKQKDKKASASTGNRRTARRR